MAAVLRNDGEPFTPSVEPKEREANELLRALLLAAAAQSRSYRSTILS